tara:strand:+ start:16519 stop:19938 length:3420 start_codon:yes stop_codon:yes gene_type:complete
MQQIRKNTLLDISRLTNPILKLAAYLKKSDMPFYINKLNDTASTTSPNDYLKAFDSDINKTVDLINDLLIAWRNSPTNFIAELNTDNKNLNELFNVQGNTINLFNEEFNKNTDYDKNDIKNNLISSILGIKLNEYKIELKKAKDNHTEKNFLPEDATNDEKFLYLVRLADKDILLQLVKKISNIVEQQRNFRNDLSFEEKKLIDNQITFSRTMIDGVLDNSTFITQKEGVLQTSLKHSKDIKSESKIKKIYNLLKENKYFDQAEIDQDTDLDKVISILEETNKLKINISKKQIFKVRKLGNYGKGYVQGMYFPSYNIVSFDVKHPSAFIHELTHAVDFNNDFIEENLRFKFVQHFYNILKEQYFTGEYTKGKKTVKIYNFPENWHYLSNPEEIIARAGEIGYLLNKYNYQGHENIDELENFLDKVSKAQKETLSNENKDILISNNIKEYQYRPEYFGIDKLDKDNLLLIKNFYSAFYYSNKQSYDNIDYLLNEKFYLMSKNIRKRNKTQSKKFIKEENPISLLRSDNFVNLCNINKSENIFETKELFEYIVKNSHLLCKTANKDTFEIQTKRLDTFLKFALSYNELDEDYKKELKNIYFHGQKDNLFKIFSQYDKFFNDNENTRIGKHNKHLLGIIKDVTTVISKKALDYINGQISDKDYINYIKNQEYGQRNEIEKKSQYLVTKAKYNNELRQIRKNLLLHILNEEALNDTTLQYLKTTKENIKEYNSDTGMAIYLNLLVNDLNGLNTFNYNFYDDLYDVKNKIISEKIKDLPDYQSILTNSFNHFLNDIRDKENSYFLENFFKSQLDSLYYKKDKDILISFEDFTNESKLKFFKEYLIKNIDSVDFKIPKTLQSKKAIKKYPNIEDIDIINFLNNDFKIKHIKKNSRKKILEENFSISDINSKAIRKIITDPNYYEYSKYSTFPYQSKKYFSNMYLRDNQIIQEIAKNDFSEVDIKNTVLNRYNNIEDEKEHELHQNIKNHLDNISKTPEFLILNNIMHEFLRNDENFSNNDKKIENIKSFNAEEVQDTYKAMLLRINTSGLITNNDKEFNKECENRLLNILKPINESMSKKNMNKFLETSKEIIYNFEEFEINALNNNKQIKPIITFSLQNSEKFSPSNIALIGNELSKKNKIKNN